MTASFCAICCLCRCKRLRLALCTHIYASLTAWFHTKRCLQQLHRSTSCRTFAAEGHDMQSLVFNFLDELLFIFSTEFFTCKELTVTELDCQKFKVKAQGWALLSAQASLHFVDLISIFTIEIIVLFHTRDWHLVSAARVCAHNPLDLAMHQHVMPPRFPFRALKYEWSFVWQNCELIFDLTVINTAWLARKTHDQMIILMACRRGDIFDRQKHEPGTEVKAITYSAMQINEHRDKAELYVIVDIWVDSTRHRQPYACEIWLLMWLWLYMTQKVECLLTALQWGYPTRDASTTSAVSGSTLAVKSSFLQRLLSWQGVFNVFRSSNGSIWFHAAKILLLLKPPLVTVLNPKLADF